MLVVPSLFLLCPVWSSAPFSLFLFFSGAGETQTLFGDWDSLCVSPTWPRTMSLIRTPCSTSSPRFRTCSCFFCFFRRRRRSLVWWWSVAFCLVSLCLGGVFLGLVLAALFCTHMYCDHVRETGQKDKTSFAPLGIIVMIIFGEKGEDRFPACLPDTQIRSHPPHPLPAECCKGQPRKGVGDNIVRQPYCHTLSGTSVGFSPFSKGGEMLSVFFILCFSCLVRCL